MNSLQSTFFHVPMAFLSLLLTIDDMGIYSLNSSWNKSLMTISVLFISMVYFILDIQLMYKYYKSKYDIYFFHHLIAIVSIPLSYMKMWNYTRYVIYYLTFELSTLFYNLSYELLELGYDSNHILSRISQGFFVSIFIIIRILFGTYITTKLIIEIIKDNTLSNYYCILPLSLQILMYYWLYYMIRKIYSRKNTPNLKITHS